MTVAFERNGASLPEDRHSIDVVQAIGSLFMQCAAAETSILVTLNALQCYPGPARLKTALTLFGMNISSLLTKIDEIGRFSVPNYHSNLKEICSEISNIFARRNELAHNFAMESVGGNAIKLLPFRLKKGGQLLEVEYTVDDIKGWTDRLAQLVRHLSEVLDEMGVKPEIPTAGEGEFAIGDG